MLVAKYEGQTKACVKCTGRFMDDQTDHVLSFVCSVVDGEISSVVDQFKKVETATEVFVYQSPYVSEVASPGETIENKEGVILNALTRPKLGDDNLTGIHFIWYNGSKATLDVALEKNEEKNKINAIYLRISGIIFPFSIKPNSVNLSTPVNNSEKNTISFVVRFADNSNNEDPVPNEVQVPAWKKIVNKHAENVFKVCELYGKDSPYIASAEESAFQFVDA